MYSNRIHYVLAIIALLTALFPLGGARLESRDPIPGYLAQVSQTNLTKVATDLVTLYGPRRWDTYSPYIDDKCTLSNSIVYPRNTLAMSVDYVRGLFEAMGYPPASITLETVPQNAGENIYVTKVGSAYPDIFIEFVAHIDSAPGTPGGSDNASGSAAVIELARVLKDYPNRYSMRFILFVAEEYDHPWGTTFFGSNYHVRKALDRGEQIKAALNMDGVGWHYPSDPTGYMNHISYFDSESERIADMLDQVRVDYGIHIGFSKSQGGNSDERSYWDHGFPAVNSGGGWVYYRPNFHGCGDTASNINFVNIFRVTQQNLAVGLRLDAETTAGDASVATSTIPAGSAPAATLTPAEKPITPKPTCSR